MSLLFATLGYRPQTLLPVIKKTSQIEEVIFYHDLTDSAIKARDEVVRYCESMDLPCVPTPIDDAFDFVRIAKKIRQDVRAHAKDGRSVRTFNIAGGTKLMSSAALLVCILEGIPATYVHDKTLKPFDLPLLRMRYSDTLTPKQRTLLRYLLDNKDSDMTEIELAKALGVEKATMNHHISRLVEKGALTLAQKKGDRRAKIVKVNPAIELLLE